MVKIKLKSWGQFWGAWCNGGRSGGMRLPGSKLRKPGWSLCGSRDGMAGGGGQARMDGGGCGGKENTGGGNGDIGSSQGHGWMLVGRGTGSQPMAGCCGGMGVFQVGMWTLTLGLQWSGQWRRHCIKDLQHVIQSLTSTLSVVLVGA